MNCAKHGHADLQVPGEASLYASIETKIITYTFLPLLLPIID